MIAEQTCLSEQDLRAFSSGRVPTDRFDRWLQHLDQCSQCQQRAEAISGTGDSLALALAAPHESDDPILAEPDCQAALLHAGRTAQLRLNAVLPPVPSLGPYRLLRPLGRGGMGAVYLAEHQRLRKKFAIKLLPRERGFDADWRQRFEREMQAVASLEHPAIVTATDAGDADGWHYLVMEYLDGLDLAAVVRRLGKLPVPVAAALMREVSLALAAIHQAGLIHRDVKPSNVMLTYDGKVKLLDLGLVFDGRPSAAEMRLTTVGHVLGTLAFAAPEQLNHQHSIDHRADLYGVGATLFQLLTGLPPHRWDRGIAPLVIEKTSQPARSLHSAGAEVPADLEQLVSELLKRDPAERPTDAATVADRLEPLAETGSLKSLVARARRCEDSSEPLAVPWTQQGSNVATAPPNKRNLAWPLWLIGLAAILATIVFYVQTDRGVLVIESEVDDVKLSIVREGDAVESLQVDTGENQTTLRSGSYRIELDAPSDSLVLSDDSVAVRRGSKTLVTIRRQAELPVAAIATQTADKLYKGQPLQQWLHTLRVERDVDTLLDAINAVVNLADPDDVETAHEILVVTRRLGGWIAGSDDPSGRFMEGFPAAFAKLPPQTILAAITKELPQSNPNSLAASLWVLRNLIGGGFTNDQPPVPLPDWAQRNEHRELLTQLHQQLRTLLQSPDQLDQQLTLPNLRELSLTFGLAVDATLAQEPGLQEHLQQKIAVLPDGSARMQKALQDLRDGRLQIDFQPSLNTAETLAAIRVSMDLPPAAAVFGLLYQDANFRQQRNELYLRRLQQDPAAYADFSWLWLAKTPQYRPFSTVSGISDPNSLILANEPLWIEALPKISAATTQPALAKKVLSLLPTQPGTQNSGLAAYATQPSPKLIAAINIARTVIAKRFPEPKPNKRQQAPASMDPFGGNPLDKDGVKDPFGGNADDPFRENSNDPFGGDPFNNNGVQDPFRDNSDDPFGK